MGVVRAINKHCGAKNFSDFANAFMVSVTGHFKTSSRVDVVFDRYNETSVKSGTILRRAGSHQTVCKNVSGRDIPLPQNWSQFISLSENKSSLIEFLSDIVETEGKPLSQEQDILQLMGSKWFQFHRPR